MEADDEYWDLAKYRKEKEDKDLAAKEERIRNLQLGGGGYSDVAANDASKRVGGEAHGVSSNASTKETDCGLTSLPRIFQLLSLVRSPDSPASWSVPRSPSPLILSLLKTTHFLPPRLAISRPCHPPGRPRLSCQGALPSPTCLAYTTAPTSPPLLKHVP